MTKHWKSVLERLNFGRFRDLRWWHNKRNKIKILQLLPLWLHSRQAPLAEVSVKERVHTNSSVQVPAILITGNISSCYPVGWVAWYLQSSLALKKGLISSLNIPLKVLLQRAILTNYHLDLDCSRWSKTLAYFHFWDAKDIPFHYLGSSCLANPTWPSRMEFYLVVCPVL
jgi:hypothetical protein